MGAFVPFKDFKGNVNDAMQKMCRDLKSFGYSNWKNIKVEQIRQGYGDQVCDIITELINLELYRRDFKFMSPVFPPEPEDDDEDIDAVENTTQSEGFSEHQFIVSQGRIDAVEMSTLNSTLLNSGFSKTSSRKQNKQFN